MANTAAKRASAVTEAELAKWKLLAAFQQRLRPVLEKAPPTPTEQDPRRQLLPAEYFSMLLFGLLNPVLESTRALCAATTMERMQAEVSRRKVSLGSFSEMQHLVEPELLAGVIRWGQAAGQAGTCNARR